MESIIGTKILVIGWVLFIFIYGDNDLIEVFGIIGLIWACNLQSDCKIAHLEKEIERIKNNEINNRFL